MNHSPVTTHIEDQPGYWIRRLQQIAVALFLQETQGLDITPVQYGTLQAICNRPGMEQGAIAAQLGLDTSTLGTVLNRMEDRGWCTRRAAPHDKRVRLLHPTPQGHALLTSILPRMQTAQARILAPLSAHQQQQFMQLLVTVVEGNNAHSRAPTQPPNDQSGT